MFVAVVLTIEEGETSVAAFSSQDSPQVAEGNLQPVPIIQILLRAKINKFGELANWSEINRLARRPQFGICPIR